MFFVVVLSNKVDAQPVPPAISPRVVAISGRPDDDSDKPTWEPWIAATNSRVMVVCNFGRRGSDGSWVGYGMAMLAGSSWSWSNLSEQRWPYPPFSAESHVAIDATIAASTVNGEFVCSADVIDGGSGNESMNTSVRLAGGAVNAWIEQYDTNQGLNADRPHVVVGEVLSGTQEYYQTFMSIDQHQYRRSRDGGTTWGGGVISVGDVSLGELFCPVPSSAADGSLLVVYVAEASPPLGKHFRLVRGVDDANADTVTFSHVSTELGQTLTIDPRLNAQSILSKLPAGTPFGGQVRVFATLACDPIDANRAYVAYMDIPSAGSSDLDVYCVRLTRTPATGFWTAGSPVKMSTDNASWESDQFLPAITVDPFGNVHAIFYDDRDFEQDDSETRPKFEVYYALSGDHGDTWTNWKLTGSPSTLPAFDRAVWDNDDTAVGELGEYIGIAASPNGTIWAAYPGTKPDDAGHKSVIWVSRIVP